MALQLFKIASTTVETPQSAITFSSIPQGYTDLKLVVSARTARATGTADNLFIQMNTDTSTNYSARTVSGVQTVTSSASQSAATPTSIYVNVIAQDNNTAGVFGNLELYIPNYTSSNQKSFFCDSVQENNTAGDGIQRLGAGLWTGTAAINQLVLSATNNFLANSTFTLYGVL